MSDELKLIFIPDDCDQACPVITACHFTALDLAARAQSAFQGFLKCLEHNIQEHWHPEYKNSTRLLEVFTHKLDETQIFSSICENYCPHKNAKGKFDAQSVADDEGAEAVNYSNQDAELLLKLTEEMAHMTQMYSEVCEQNLKWQERCEALESEVSTMLEELTKRRNQFSNRILVSVFEQSFANHKEQFSHKGVFDIIPRDHIGDFIQFVRNILLGPALAQNFDDKVEQLVEGHKDEHGCIGVGQWEKVMQKPQTKQLMVKVAHMLFERTLSDSFHQLVIRKSGVPRRHVPAFIQLLEFMQYEGQACAEAV